jgi:hypothetical protein
MTRHLAQHQRHPHPVPPGQEGDDRHPRPDRRITCAVPRPRRPSRRRSRRSRADRWADAAADAVAAPGRSRTSRTRARGLEGRAPREPPELRARREARHDLRSTSAAPSRPPRRPRAPTCRSASGGTDGSDRTARRGHVPCRQVAVPHSRVRGTREGARRRQPHDLRHRRPEGQDACRWLDAHYGIFERTDHAGHAAFHTKQFQFVADVHCENLENFS